MTTLDSFSWQDAEIVSTQYVADGIRRITLRPAKPKTVKPGEHVKVRVWIDGKEHTRSYSIVDATDDGSEISLTIFRVPNSRGGSVYMHGLSEGDVLRTTEPQQNFPLRIGAKRYVLMAGGIGITAVMNMARVLARVKADYQVIYVGRSHEAMAYADQLVAEHGDKVHVHTDDVDGIFDVQRFVEGIDEGTELYMCGPIRLMDAVRRTWLATELEPTNLRFETFGNSGWFEPEPFTVDVPRLGVKTSVGPDESLLDALERAGLETMFSCKKGECGICQIKVLHLEGQIDHRDVFHSEEEKAANTRLCGCVSRVVTGKKTSETTTEQTASITIDVS